MPAVTRASGLTPGPRWVRPPWFSKPVMVGRPSAGSGVAGELADGPGRAAVGGEVEQVRGRRSCAPLAKNDVPTSW